MRISSDISIIDVDGDSYKIYNRHLHKLSSVHKLIYDYLENAQKKGRMDNIYNELSEDQINILLEYGVLLDDEESYLSRKFMINTSKPPKKIKTAYLHLIMECNLKCEYCYINPQLGFKHKNLTTEEWIKILDNLKQVGVEEVVLTGGEVTLHKGFINIVKHAHSLSLHITVLSNGTLFYPNKIEVFEYINIAIISLDALIDSRRKGIENYPVFDNIINIAKKYPEKITVRSVVSRGYENDAEILKEELSKYGVKQIKSICLPNTKEDIDLIPDYDTFEFYGNTLVGLCGAGSTLIAIDSIGNIYPCQTLVKPEFIIANILEPNWLDDFNKNTLNDEINCFGFNQHKNTKCQTCVALHFCNGGCRSIAYSVYNDFSHRTEFLCEFYKKSAINTLKEGSL